MSSAQKRWLKRGGVLAAMLVVAFVAAFGFRGENVIAARDDYRTALAERHDFKQVVHRTGTLKPVKEQHIFAKVGGVILEMAPQGKVVEKGEVLLRLDPRPHEDLRATQEALIVQEEAEFKKLDQDAAKLLNQAKEDVASYELRLELEKMRLDELKKGASASEVITAEVNLKNAKNLLNAKQEEMNVLDGLAKFGYASREEVRQKQLDVTEQRLQVEQAEIKYRRLAILDPVKLGEQDLKVKESIKTRDVAKEKAALMERNIQRDRDRHKLRMEREKERLNELTENIAKTVHTAPGPGVVVHRKGRWYTFSPGREVWDGQEVIALPDFTKMKVALTVDEARIGYVGVGQDVEVRPAGWKGEPFKGKVTMVAEKGRDEFEVFTDETIALSGTANRQVFDVEVEIENSATVLRPGLRADVDIILRTLANAVVIPRTALVRDKEGATIVRVETSSGAQTRPVKVIAESELNAAVEGVQEKERVWVIEHNE